MRGGPPPDDPRTRLLELLGGRVRAQAVASAAALGLADQLVDGPRTAVDLAERTGCDADRLERLLRYLAALDVCTADPDGRFGLGELGRLLTDDALGPLAAFLGHPDQWDPWSRLPQALRGQAPSAFQATHGRPLYDQLAADPDADARYDRAMAAFTRGEALALAETADLSGVRRLVDLGAGSGLFLRTLLLRWPELEGVLADRPPVAEAALARAPAALAPRLSAWGGDFHREVPVDADAYLLAHVLHNWDDGAAADLLARCAAGLRPGGRVLIVETLLLPLAAADTARQLDLEMLVLTGGRERDKPSWRRLLARAGLALDGLQRLSDAGWLLTARPAAG